MGSTVKPPFLVALNLTRRCNLRCAHCYLDAGTRLDGDARELTTDEVRDILDGIATLSVETMVVFTGGEPTLRRDLPDLVSYAAGLGLMPVIGTNGTLLDDGRLQALKGAGLQGAGISIDSLNPSFHDDFRGLAGCWDKAMAGIDACRRIGIRFQIHFSVTEDNAHELDDMIAFAKSAKAFVLNVFFLVCTGRGEKFSDISPETYEAVLRRVTQAAHDEQGLIVRAKCAPHFKRMALELDPAWPVTAAHGYEAGGCLAGTRYFRITPEGEVTACPYMEEPIGDLRQTDVATLWRDAPGFRRLREPKLEGRCGVCEYAKLCGGCRARPLARDGNMMGEDFVCTYQPQGGAVIEPLPDRGAGLVWTADAEVWLERIPSFVRRFVRQRAEDKVRADGGAEVTAEIIGALARERFKGRGGKTHQGNKRMTVDVAIIGGGISGLATAYSLKRLGLDVVVLERQARPGGNAQTERIGGFLMEHGPSTVNASSAAAAGFSKDLGLDAMRCNLGDAVRKRYLVAGGALSGISAGPMGFLTSGYLSLPGRLRMMAEFLLPHQLDGEDETVMAFFSRRFGKEFAERVIDPMVAGIYAGKASELSVSAVFPKLVALEREFGSVSLGMFRRYQQGAKMPGSRLYSWRDGIDTLPRALAARLGDGLRTGIAVRHVRRGPGGFKIDAGQAGSIEAKTVVLATQPHVAARFLDGLDDAAAAAAGEIKAPPLAVVFLGFRRDQVDHPLDGLGFLTSRGEKRLLSGAQFSSTMFPGRAPEECIAVTGYFGGARSPELARLSEGDLIGLARQEFSELIGAHGDPVVARVKHWPLGLPQYEIGHLKRAACLRDAEKRTPGLFITGNYFDGPSVASCLGLAKETAAAVSGYLADLEKPVDMDVWESAVSG